MYRYFLVFIFPFVVATRSTGQTATAYYHQGLNLKNENKIREAIEAFRQATQLDPDYREAWYEMGWCSNDRLDFTNALVYLRKARNLWTGIPKVHFELGYAFENLNLHDSAILQFNRCLELKPDYSMAHRELGYIAYSREQYESATVHFSSYERFAEIPSSDYLYWYRKGFTLNALKKYADALTALTKSRSLKNKYINTHLELGFACSRLKQNDSALAHYKNAMSIDPANYIPYNGIAEVYRDNTRDISQAMSWYQKTLAIKPHERKANFGMGYCFNSKGDYNQAITYLEQAIASEANYTAAYVELGYAHYMLKNYARGLGYLTKAISINPSNENARYYAGLIYVAQQNKSMAQQMVDELKELKSKNATALQEHVNKMG